LFVRCTVTGDETRLNHYDPETKIAKHAVETRQFSKLSQIQGTGISWPVFWDAEGILLIDNMLTITAVYYADLLHKLHVAVKKQ